MEMDKGLPPLPLVKDETDAVQDLDIGYSLRIDTLLTASSNSPPSLNYSSEMSLNYLSPLTPAFPSNNSQKHPYAYSHASSKTLTLHQTRSTSTVNATPGSPSERSMDANTTRKISKAGQLTQSLPPSTTQRYPPHLSPQPDFGLPLPDDLHKSGNSLPSKMKSSTSSFALGLGKSLSRMGSVIKRNTFDSSQPGPSSLPATPVNRQQTLRRKASILAWNGSGSRSHRPVISQTLGEEWERVQKSPPRDDLSGDDGITRPLTITHDLHVSPDLEDLPEAWLSTLKAQGLTEQDLLLISTARRRQHQVAKMSLPLNDALPPLPRPRSEVFEQSSISNEGPSILYQLDSPPLPAKGNITPHDPSSSPPVPTSTTPPSTPPKAIFLNPLSPETPDSHTTTQYPLSSPAQTFGTSQTDTSPSSSARHSSIVHDGLFSHRSREGKTLSAQLRGFKEMEVDCDTDWGERLINAGMALLDERKTIVDPGCMDELDRGSKPEGDGRMIAGQSEDDGDSQQLEANITRLESIYEVEVEQSRTTLPATIMERIPDPTAQNRIHSSSPGSRKHKLTRSFTTIPRHIHHEFHTSPIPLSRARPRPTSTPLLPSHSNPKSTPIPTSITLMKTNQSPINSARTSLDSFGVHRHRENPRSHPISRGDSGVELNLFMPSTIVDLSELYRQSVRSEGRIENEFMSAEGDKWTEEG